MKLSKEYYLLYFFILHAVSSFGQQTVHNPGPYITTRFPQYIYIGYDNPIHISTGNKKKLKLYTDNGVITPAKENGDYFIKPSRTGETIVTLQSKRYKQEFHFLSIPMQYPGIELAGSPNEDGVVAIRPYSTGIRPSMRIGYPNLGFRVDSFTIEIIDSLSRITHVNIGAAWDATSQNMIWKARGGSRLNIYNVYMNLEGRSLKSQAWLEAFFWKYNY